jgi:hypothetical protein
MLESPPWMRRGATKWFHNISTYDGEVIEVIEY